MPRKSMTQENPTPRATVSKIIGLRGEYRPDVVTQFELAELKYVQLAAWHAGRHAALLSERLRVRIQEGASVEAGKLYFDEGSDQSREMPDAITA